MISYFDVFSRYILVNIVSGFFLFTANILIFLCVFGYFSFVFRVFRSIPGCPDDLLRAKIYKEEG